jgi:Na+/H+ antiporter NhaD/arsenite permease-like protein
MTAVLAVGIFVITYTLIAMIATELIPRVWAAIVGVVAMAVVGLLDTETAFYNPD